MNDRSDMLVDEIVALLGIPEGELARLNPSIVER